MARRARPLLSPLLLAAACVAAPVLAVATPAGGASSATCSLDVMLRLRPGLVLSTTEGAVVAQGLAGNISCTGMIEGGLVTGPGRFGVDGTMRGSCAEGYSTGRAPFEIPTTAGIVSGVADYTVTWKGLAGQFTAVGRGYGYGTGAFEFTPNEGNCLDQPMTLIRFRGEQLVASS